MHILGKIIYHLKIHLLRYVSFLFVFVLSSITLSFYMSPSVKDISSLMTYSSISDVNEIWFGSSPVSDDCYINLNGSYFFSTNNKAINADVLMQMNEVKYEHNIFHINYHLNDDECLISKNLASEYHLAVGDQIISKEYSFTVKDFLSPLEGIDEKYNHEGIIVLANKDKMLINKPISYIYFSLDGSGALNATKLVSLKDKKDSYKRSLLIKGLTIVGIFTVISLITELVIFAHKKSSYALYLNMGERPSKLFGLMLVDSLIKYPLAILLSSLIFIGLTNVYLIPYLICVSYISVIMIIISLITASIYFIRRGKYE